MKLYKLLLLLLVSFFYIGCNATAGLSGLLGKVDSEKTALDKKIEKMGINIINSYLDKHKESMGKGVFESEDLNIMSHIKKRISNIDCEYILKNDQVTLNYLFIHLNYLDYKCIEQLSLENDMEYLLFYVGISDNAVQFLKMYSLSKEIPKEVMGSIYDIAFIYCDQFLIDYLAENGVRNGKLFSEDEYSARNSNKEFSC